jgi:hypothetical protein
MLDGLDTHAEALNFMLAKHFNEGLSTIPIYLTSLGNVVSHGRQQLLVEFNERVQGAFGDIQCREGRQKVITDEKAEEYEVVDDSLKVETHTHGRCKRGVL